MLKTFLSYWQNKSTPMWVVALAAGMLLVSVPALVQRVREETHDHRVAIATEWSEYRDFNARLATTEDVLLRELQAHGATALVVAPMTLNDLIQQHRVRLIGPSQSADPLDVTRLSISDPALAHQLLTQWTWRGVTHLKLQQNGLSAILIRSQGSFSALKDSDVGYDRDLMHRAKIAGLIPILRINFDPWLSDTEWLNWLEDLPLAASDSGVLFNSDDLPGGLSQISSWTARLRSARAINFLSEFHPAIAAWQVANALPMQTYRTHSIPASELKDLKLEQQFSRWHRAVAERSCRLLLVRMGPSDSRDSYLEQLTVLKEMLGRLGWQSGFPVPHNAWTGVTRWQRYANPLIAFGIVVVTPLMAWRWGKTSAPHWRTAFFKITLASLGGALLAAAIAQNPLTRLEIIPFRGVKLAFILSWVLVLLSLYDLQELQTKLAKHVRRWDLLVGGAAAVCIGYLLIRTGNASSLWKPSWEQSVRDLLESALVARPRFKEFVIGYPALWLGLYMQYASQDRPAWVDARSLIGLGMLGPISMINTFCHLHSPLLLELFRTVNGWVLGVLIGMGALYVMRPLLREVQRRMTPTRAKVDPLVYMRS